METINHNSTTERLDDLKVQTMFSGHIDKLESKLPGCGKRLTPLTDQGTL